MKFSSKLSPFLLYRDQDFNPESKPPWNSADLIHDLGFDIILESMGKGDKEVRRVCEQVLLSPILDAESIHYRQKVVGDSISNSAIIRAMYSILTETIKRARERLFWVSRGNPDFTLHESIAILRIYLHSISRLRKIARDNRSNFKSPGFEHLFSLFTDVFDEGFEHLVSGHLSNLEFPNGIGVQGSLGRGNELTGFQLLVPEAKRRLMGKLNMLRDRRYTFVLPDRDDIGVQELGQLRSRAIISVSNALSESAENVLSFLLSLTSELAFLVGCINLKEELGKSNCRTAFPLPLEHDKNKLEFVGLYDMALAIKLKGNIIPNALTGKPHQLIIITGANRGGKSTFLRSIGQSLMMMQAGVFVAAEQFSSSVFSGVYTHFKREEDREMRMGKFDEELHRMNDIVEHINERDIILFNESFSSTNPREGAEIATEIVTALLEKQIKVIFVTHLYDLASSLMNSEIDGQFLIAERLANGERTFRIQPGMPEKTSYGLDIYLSIFKTQV